jgi:transcription-repair coupling factor (superfamily II helicase)
MTDIICHPFVQRLLKIGYNRVMKVMEHGEFSVKGSLIDIYPMGMVKSQHFPIIKSKNL